VLPHGCASQSRRPHWSARPARSCLCSPWRPPHGESLLRLPKGRARPRSPRTRATPRQAVVEPPRPPGSSGCDRVTTRRRPQESEAASFIFMEAQSPPLAWERDPRAPRGSISQYARSVQRNAQILCQPGFRCFSPIRRRASRPRIGTASQWRSYACAVTSPTSTLSIVAASLPGDLGSKGLERG
jgi:hypothetical protein